MRSNAPWKYAPSQQAKAIIGAVYAGLTTLAGGMADDGVTWGEWLGVLVAVVATYLGVFVTNNAGEHKGSRLYGDADSPDESGRLDVLYALCVIAAVILILLMLRVLL